MQNKNQKVLSLWGIIIRGTQNYAQLVTPHFQNSKVQLFASKKVTTAKTKLIFDNCIGS